MCEPNRAKSRTAVFRKDRLFLLQLITGRRHLLMLLMASTTIREHIRNPSTNWKCIGFNTNLLAEQISAIHLVAHENVENVGGDGQPPTNHWTLFLALEDGGSIQVNACPGTPVPSRSGYPGLILVSPESCAFANANAAVVSGTPASENTTIEVIFSCIIANGRDRYDTSLLLSEKDVIIGFKTSPLILPGLGSSTRASRRTHMQPFASTGRTQRVPYLSTVPSPAAASSPRFNGVFFALISPRYPDTVSDVVVRELSTSWCPSL